MEFISSWVQGIIVAVVIATIIEMILPEGSSKKYIKIVIGVYIIFNIISPMINKFTGNELNFTSIVDLDKYEKEISAYEVKANDLDKNNNYNIRQVYILNLKNDMKAKIQEKGYVVNGIYIELEETEDYKVERLNLSISKKEDKDDNTNSTSNTINRIEEINIQVQIDKNQNNIETTTHLVNVNNDEIKDIKDYINSIYEIDKSIIHINE